MQATAQQETASLTQGRQTKPPQGTLSSRQKKGGSLAEVAHDARNLVTALGLYCELLQEPGVLATPYLHYGKELGMLAAASRSLADKLAALGSRNCLLCSMAGLDIGPNRFRRHPLPTSPPRFWPIRPCWQRSPVL
jgi:hypothetical protein